jgi:ABC-type amino acid transport substrate-binding protein
MKHHIHAALVAALVAGLITLLAPRHAETPAPVVTKQENAYERVMRTGTLRCGFIAWPPGFEVDANTKEVKGPTKEIFESIIKLTGWQAEFIEVPLGTVATELKNGRIDAMCADGPFTISTVKYVDYTSWAFYTPVFVYLRANESQFTDLRKLNDPAVEFVGIDGDLSVDLVTLRFPKAKIQTLSNMTDPAQMLLNVIDGKADAVILDPYTAEAFMRNNPGKIQSYDAEGPLAVYPLGFSVRWGEPELKAVLSRATEMAQNIGLLETRLDLYDPNRRIIYSPAAAYQIGGK